MTRSAIFARLLLAGILAFAPRALAARDDGELGSRCSADRDCTSGLRCWTAPAPGAAEAGPAHGLCTAPCNVDAECWVHRSGALCVDGKCREACKTDAPSRSDLNPVKCHEREDMVCSARLCLGPECELDCFDQLCTVTSARCLPLCARDEDCGQGVFCNLATGLCQTEPPPSDPPGSACEYGAPETTCAGICDVDGAAMVVENRLLGTCVEPCVIGEGAACGGRALSACIGTFHLAGEGHAPGDLGVCIDVCNCSSDCGAGSVCVPIELDDALEAAGICESGERSSDVPDCLGAGGRADVAECEYGPVRACRTAECLGTADCLPDGTYGECHCLPSGTAGRSAVPAPAPPKLVTTGCGIVARSEGENFVLGALLVLGALRFRRALRGRPHAG